MFGGSFVDNFGLRICFDAGLDMLGEIRRNFTDVARVLRSTALPATRLANEKPRDLARGFVAIEEIRLAASYAFRFLRQRP